MKLLLASLLIALPTIQQPLVHDPVMAYEDGTYYLYCTGHDIAQMTSKDLKNWTVNPNGVLFDKVPLWTFDSVPGLTHHLWAPDVIHYNNRWYMAYSCSTFGKNTSAIGLLSNDKLSNTVGWKDEGCLIASKGGRDNWNAIDPNFVIDDDNNPWLVWGSFWDGIQLVPLDNTMHVLKGGRQRTIARRGAGKKAIEAPFIFKHDGYYYLFVSWDCCCRGIKSDYRVVVGRSKSVTGPYLDDHGIDMLDGGGYPVISGDKKNYEAAGHCAVYHFSGKDIFICHGYKLPDGESVLIEKQIRWKKGWPKLARL